MQREGKTGVCHDCWKVGVEDQHGDAKREDDRPFGIMALRSICINNDGQYKR